MRFFFQKLSLLVCSAFPREIPENSRTHLQEDRSQSTNIPIRKGFSQSIASNIQLESASNYQFQFGGKFRNPFTVCAQGDSCQSQSPGSKKSHLPYPYNLFGEPPKNSAEFDTKKDLTIMIGGTKFQSRLYTAEEISSKTEGYDLEVIPDEKVTILRQLGNGEDERYFALYIKEERNFLFPRVVIEDTRMTLGGAKYFEIAFKSQNRISKVMFHKVEFSPKALDEFSFKGYNSIKEVLFIDCNINYADTIVLKWRGKENGIKVIIEEKGKRIE